MEEAPQWFKDHIKEDKLLFEERPTKIQMKEIVYDALIDFFEDKGRMTKNILVTTAVVIGALVVIGGGFKWILGLFGYSIMK